MSAGPPRLNGPQRTPTSSSSSIGLPIRPSRTTVTGQSRMSAIRTDIETLIDRYPQARFALIAFASRPSLDWPLSEDAWSLKPEVARLAPYRRDRRGRERRGRCECVALSAHCGGPAVPGLQESGVLLRVGRSRLPRTAGRVRSDPEFGRRRRRYSATARRRTHPACNGSPSNSVCPTSTAMTADPISESAPDSGSTTTRHPRGDGLGHRRAHRTLLGLHAACRRPAAVRAVRQHP